MSFKVSFQSFTGHDEMDADGAPDVIEFETEEERKAFLLGVNMTSEALDGWLDGSVEVSFLPRVSEHAPEVLRAAKEFLLATASSPTEMAAKAVAVQDWLGQGGSLSALAEVAREMEGHPLMSPMLMAFKESLLG